MFKVVTYKITILLILSLSFPIVFGQERDLAFQHISVEDGLSQSTVYCVFQDETGLIWIGTQNGLNRFDGYDFSNFVHNRNDSNSISHNFINVIFQDRSGSIWVGTNNGLNIIPFNSTRSSTGEIFYKFKNDSNDSNILNSNIIQAIYQDRNGYVWIGTNKGLDRTSLPIEKPSKEINFITINLNQDGSSNLHNKNNYVKSIIEDKNENLWIGTLGNGLIKYDKKSSRVRHFKNNSSNPGSISSNYVITLFIDHSGNLWIGTYNGGLNKFDPISKKFTFYKNNPSEPGSISDNHVYSIKEGLDGKLWLATFGGINMFDPKKGKFLAYKNTLNNPNSLSSNFVRCLLIDKSNNLWAGTNKGINKVDLKPEKFSTYKKNPNKLPTFSSNSFLSFYEDNAGVIWIGTIKGLDKYDIKTGKITNFKILHNQTESKEGFIYGIEPGKKNILWLGSLGGGLYKFNVKTKSLKQFLYIPNDTNSIIDSRVTALLTDHNNHLLIGTVRGVCVFDKDKEKILPETFAALPNVWINNIYQDRNKNYWFATNGGLYLFNKHKDLIKVYKHSDSNLRSLTNNFVYSVCEDQKGNVWVGTHNGLNKINTNLKIIDQFFKKDGLPSNSISSIVLDNQGNLWISTFNGISKLDPELDKIKFYNYGLNDGVASLEFTIAAAFKNKKGEIYFGSLNGFNKFNPAEVYDNPYPPKVIITTFYKFNKLKKTFSQLRNLNSIKLDHDEQFFSFEFASLDFTNPPMNKYAYMLEGFDEDWNFIGNRRFASYTNLDPGEYIFKVKATNNDGIWSEAPAQIGIFISPPFWETWWFRIIAFLFIIGGAALIYQRRIKNLEHEKKVNEEFSKRLIQSQEDERKRIASELHDGIGQNLLIIKNYASLGKRVKTVETGIEHFEEISDNAASTIDEVRRIAYNLHPYHLERLGLTNAVLSIIDNAEASSNINFEIKSDNIDNILTKEAEINLFRIIQECINNIIKHSSANNADIIIKKNSSDITVNINDNGKGISSADKLSPVPVKGFGMENLKKRVSIIKAEFKIRSEHGKGTRVSIRIPV